MLKPNTPLYLKDVTFTTETKDGEVRRVVNASFRIAPFTAELAETLGAGVRERLFRRGNAEPVDEIAEIKFNLAEPLQTLKLKGAADVENDTLVIADVKVKPIIRVKRDKETPTFEGNIDVNFVYPAANDLLFLVNCINNQLVSNWSDQQASMLDDQEQPSEDEQQTPKRSRKPRAAPAAEEEAATVN